MPAAWFNRSALLVARELLGKYLVRRYRGRTIAAMITETEAYIGPQDLASHAARGRRTARTAVMFGRPGRWYIYFTYGMHWLSNIVTGRKGHPAAVLIRGVRGISGPARVTRTFRIVGSFNSMPANRRSGLWIEDRGIRVPRRVRGPRVGVGYAGPVWAKKPYRFLIYEK
ncbi:MAG: DNA-3-methyladenine glycosylase [bacterium]|nr:DNA-3-methyladenine glycosylase [bacterium]